MKKRKFKKYLWSSKGEICSFDSRWNTKLLQSQVGRNGLWPKNVLVLTGRDSDGSGAVRSDEHPQLGISGYSMSMWELPGTVIQKHLTKTTEKKSPPGPSWPFLCQQKGSSRRSLVGFRPRQPSFPFQLIQRLARSCLGRAPSDLSAWDVGAETFSRGAAARS